MSAYPKVLRRFFLRVHPDLFQQLPAQQQVNAQSFQKLLALLDWHRRLKAGKIAPPPPADTLTFHCRIDTAIHKVETEWNPPGDASSARSVQRVDAAMQRLIQSLLHQSGVQEEQQRLEEKDPKEVEEDLVDNFTASLRQCWADARTPSVDVLIAADMIRVSTSLSPHATIEGLLRLHKHLPSLQYHRWYGIHILLTDHYSVTDVPGFVSLPWDFEEDQCLEFILANCDILQRAQEHVLMQAQEIENAIAAVQEALGLQELIIPGTPQSVPWQYLLDRDPVAASNDGANHDDCIPRDAATSSSFTSVSRLIGEESSLSNHNASRPTPVPKEYSAALSLSAPHRLQRALGVLKSNAGTLQQSFTLHGLAWELGAQWGVRQNGRICLCLPALLGPEGSSQLFTFLQRIEPNMDLYRQQATESRQLQNLINLYVTRMEAILRCPVDVSYPIAYVKKVVFLQELWRIVYHLAEWNWDNFYFELGPSVDLNWEGRRFILPYDIDAFKLLTYIRFYLRELFHSEEITEGNDGEVWMYGAHNESWAKNIDLDDAPHTVSKGADHPLQREVGPEAFQAAIDEAAQEPPVISSAEFAEFGSSAAKNITRVKAKKTVKGNMVDGVKSKDGKKIQGKAATETTGRRRTEKEDRAARVTKALDAAFESILGHRLRPAPQKLKKKSLAKGGKKSVKTPKASKLLTKKPKASKLLTKKPKATEGSSGENDQGGAKEGTHAAVP